MLDSERNFRYTFISNLQQYLEIVKKLANEFFDSIINILNQEYERTENEAKQVMWSKFN
jgi:hypothetical protein